MKHFFRLASLAVLALLAHACSERRHAVNTLQRVAAMVEQQPDSALLLLEAMEPPHHLHSEYTLRYLQAKDKANRYIADDTAVFVVSRRYVQEQDRKMAAPALFYSGRVYHEQGKYDKATRAYLMADDYAQGSRDYNLQGLINSNLGRLSYEKRLFDRAAAYYKKALQSFQTKTIKYSNIAWTLVDLGNSFLLNELPDSAMLYYNRGLDVAEQHRDTVLLFTIYQCVGVAFQQQGEHEQAKQYFKQLERQGVSHEHRAALYCNLGSLYFDLSQKDSARYYAQQALSLQEKDSIATAELVNAYGLLTDLEDGVGSYKKALHHSKKQAELLVRFFDEKEKHSILEVQEKFQNEKLKNKNSELLIEKQRFMVAVLLLILAVLAVGATFYLYRERSKKRLEKAEKNIYVLRQLSASLSDNGSELGEKEQLFRQLLAQLFDLLKNVSLLEKTLSSQPEGSLAFTQLKELVYRHNKDKWRLLYQGTNKLYGGVLDRLRSQHPELGESEFKICCLTYAKLNNTEISAVVNLSIKTVQNKKTSIRRKLGISESDDIGHILRTAI